MKQLLSLTTKKFLLIAVSVLIVGAASFYFLVAEAVEIRSVGTITATLAPNAGENGNEFVEVSYTGFGAADISGWTISNNAGVLYTFTDETVPAKSAVRVCQETTLSTKCDYHWDGDDVFVDAGDTMTLKDAAGNPVVTTTYTNSSTSTFLPNSGSYFAEVYGKGSKVEVCHMDNKSAYRAQNVNANTIVNSLDKDNGHTAHPEDIIPAFIHDVNGGLSYYGGHNWPDMKSTHANGCQ